MVTALERAIERADRLHVRAGKATWQFGRALAVVKDVWSRENQSCRETWPVFVKGRYAMTYQWADRLIKVAANMTEDEFRAHEISKAYVITCAKTKTMRAALAKMSLEGASKAQLECTLRGRDPQPRKDNGGVAVVPSYAHVLNEVLRLKPRERRALIQAATESLKLRRVA